MTSACLSRVLMTADAVGGVWPYVLELARGYAARGITTDLAVLGPLPAERGRAGTSIIGLRILETGLPLDWTAASPAEVIDAGRRVARLAEINRADLVHLNTPALAADVRFPVPVVAVVHSCLATWWSAVRQDPLPPDFAWRTELTARGLAKANAVVTVSRSLAAAVKNFYGADLDIKVVLNGRTTPPHSSVAKERFILTAGRLWDEGKNVAALDRAASALSVPFFAAGPVSGPNGAQGRFSHLRLLGGLDERELGGWYGRAPIFASAARYEPFGFTALEAGRAGAALVLSDIRSFRELWDGAAVFVGADDQYAPTLQALIDAPEELKLWSERAMRRAKRYTAERMVRDMLDLYRTVVSGALAPAA